MGIFSRLPAPLRTSLDVGRIWYSIKGLGYLLGSVAGGAGVGVGTVIATLAGFPLMAQVGFGVAGAASGLILVGCLRDHFLYRQSPIRVEGVRAVEFEIDELPTLVVVVRNEADKLADGVAVFMEISYNTSKVAETRGALVIPGRQAIEVPIQGAVVLTRTRLTALAEGNATLQLKGHVEHGRAQRAYCYKYLRWQGKGPADMPVFVECSTDTRRHHTLEVHDALHLHGTASAEVGAAPSAAGTKEPLPQPDE